MRKDPNLEYDPYFYERKAHLDKTIEAVDNGSMKMYDFNGSMDNLIDELEILADTSKYDPAIKKGFENEVSSNYLSSSSNVWNVNFKYGYCDYYNKTGELYVRCTRSEQNDTLDFDKLVSELIEQGFRNIPAPLSEIKLVKGEFETKKVAIKVDREDARAFKEEFDSLNPQAIFDYDGNSVKLKDEKQNSYLKHTSNPRQ